ncbi:S-adenosylmethionine:tRNA ribosyltransferase-isomerase [Alicyclobacillus contaminans]|uniref:tRNA preQ1(34) S-adenosylmethionine ribosyltransferase-isomerase QueA n=1 Tax=Alicyclobacillus contaminans TaxID=392016 RepID=UPI0004233516|nr:tRNA preQ1(34) S-adenosylmethionine ribosyltransferase-isomerase QueA [Alicyclobacillus contaminans]GMA51934.1 S-adenosylmethionine:tRNA ribosyltransferase-isomerase [Alicyclobacillus contaminans]
MLVDEFDYELPEELIAQVPLANREDSRLLVADPVQQSVIHTQFRSLLDYLQAGDMLVFNNSKVIPARLYAVKPDTGAQVELLLTRPRSATEWEALAKPAKRLKIGTELMFRRTVDGVPSQPDANATAVVTDVLDGGMRVVRFDVQEPFEAFLNAFGTVPLPPYIQTPLREMSRYQTVYAKPAGSVAAPTAGLHFTERMLEQVRAAGVSLEFVTLHVGIGTFRPVQVDEVEKHVMHAETYEVSEATADAVNRAKDEGRRVIAVGTTALRTLESAGQSGRLEPGRRETDIFIYPGYQFRIVDALITNFHLPKSTLIMLVAAMMGTSFTLDVYREAVAKRYRFFSFGDAMFITRRGSIDTVTGTL